ncbi:MAG: hypothetical protein CMH81_03910 [Nitrospiraceae bacterium]|nr:hypothetical protein [Nitrospiraceae bacterium]
MSASPLTTRHTRFSILVFLPLIVFGSGCGDAGNIDLNSPDTGVSGQTNSTESTGAPNPTSNTGATEATGNPEIIIINEIFPETSQIELHNPTRASADISGFWLCHTTPALIYAQIPDNTIIEPGAFLIVNWGISGTNSENEIFAFPEVPIPMNVPHGEMGLYVPFGFADDNFANSDLITDYMQWGEPNHFRQGVAVGANIWPEEAFVPSPPAGQSLSFRGNGDSPDSWISTPPTIGTENSIP